MAELGDGFEDGVEIFGDLLVGEAENPIAEGVQVGVPIGVMGDLGFFFVNGAVELQDESQLMAEEVRDVGTDGHLPAELEAVKLVAAQASPQHLLGPRGDPP